MAVLYLRRTPPAEKQAVRFTVGPPENDAHCRSKDVPSSRLLSDFPLQASDGLSYPEPSMAQQVIALKPWTEKRRSQRLSRNIPVIAHRSRPMGPAFSEGTHTIVVNAHGALISLVAKVAVDQRFILKHGLSGEQRECRVVFIRKGTGPSEVGIEFQGPALNFWKIAYPPVDWAP